MTTPLHSHPYLDGEPVRAVVAMPDASMRPLLDPGALVFVARPAFVHDRFLVLRHAGRLLVRHVGIYLGAVSLTGTATGYRHGEPGHLMLTLPPGWRAAGPLDLHPDVDVIGAAVVCGASYTAFVSLVNARASVLDAGFAVGPLCDDDAARALYAGPAAVRTSHPRRLPALFAGSAN